MHYNYFRDYDPSTGRYVQADPRGVLLDFSDPQRQLAAKQGIAIPTEWYGYVNQMYSYVDSNPLKDIDPTGEAVPLILQQILKQIIKKGTKEGLSCGDKGS